MIKLTVLAGPDAGSVFTPPDDIVVIGRGNDCDVVLHDSTVSRRHCMIQREGAAFVVSDLHTANGIFLNDPKNRINNRHVLRHKDEIIFGRCRLRVELPILAKGKQATAAVGLTVSDSPAPESLDGDIDASEPSSQVPPLVLPSSWQSAMTVIAYRPKVTPPPQQPFVNAPERPNDRRNGRLARIVAGTRQIVMHCRRFMSRRLGLRVRW